MKEDMWPISSNRRGTQRLCHDVRNHTAQSGGPFVFPAYGPDPEYPKQPVRHAFWLTRRQAGRPVGRANFSADDRSYIDGRFHQSGHTQSAKAALKRLRSAGANVLGAAMCKFAVNKFDYNYSYKYMNYQYYAYGADLAKRGATFPWTTDRTIANGNKSLLGGKGGRAAKHVAGYLARARASG